jgi:hypothetical protein
MVDRVTVANGLNNLQRFCTLLCKDERHFPTPAC